MSYLKIFILIIFGLLQFKSSFAYDVIVGGIYYNIDTNAKTAEVTYGSDSKNSYAGDIVVPQSFSYSNETYVVNAIGDFAFSWCDNLTSITLPNSVRTIGDSAFAESKNCKSIEIPNGVTSIKSGAFFGCTGLTSLSIPQSVTNIGDYAFDDCGCNMESIIVDANNSYFDSRNNCNAVIRKSDMKLLLGCKNTVIPNGVKIIGRWAFIRCVELKSINFPTSLEEIGEAAFYGCENINSLSIPYNVKKISGSAFFGCGGLESIIVDKNNLYYDSRDNCNAIIKKSDKCLVRGCVNSSIPDGVTSIEFGAFSNIEYLYSIEIPQSVTTIGDFAFQYCSNISSIELPFNLLNIGQGAFEYCTKLSSIIIPSSVISMESMAFKDCKNLSLVVSKIKDPFDIGWASFDGIAANAVLKVPKGTKSEYYNTNWVSNFKEIVEEPGNFSLVVKATGYGSIRYNETVIRDKTLTFTVEEGANATITFSPDNGNRIKMVKLNSTNVTSSVSNNQYTISNITANTVLEVEFEAIPVTTYSLSIKATGNGSASYNGTTIRSKTSTFAVNEGTKVSISVSPDNGYRIKSVKENDTNVTSYVSNGAYTINSISRNTDIEVEFEAIPPTTYTLSIKATGNGSASYDGTTIRGKTSSFTVNEGTSATIKFTPDNGYRIKIVKLNSTIVTSGVSNSQYTISNITANTTLEVEFEAIPITTYTLSIKATGNGSVSYNGNTIRSKTSTFTVNEGTKVSISLTPDNGYRIKSVKENDTNVTSYVSNGTYTINSISRNTNVEVEFEVIPPTTYTLSIKATGNGSASYDGTTIRGKTSSFTVNKGTSATIKFTPDNGYRIKIVKLNSTNVTSGVSNSQYTISNITANTTLEVEFEAIPITTYTLSIKATGNGSASYNGTTIRSKTSTFAVNEGTKVSISVSPDNGYRIKSVKENDTNVTSYVSNGAYTINSISRNTDIEVEFEVIPPTTYTLSIKATGNGLASYDGTTIRGKTSSFTVNEGTSATIKFTPDNGYRIKSVKLNSNNVTSGVSNNQYTISNITANTTLEVEFVEDVKTLAVNGVNYNVVSQTERTVNVAGGNYGQVLTIPTTVTSNGSTWKVVGIEADALNGNSELAAIIWDPEVTFTATVSNPNLLLYVKAERYASSSVQNVVVNGTASNIVLAEAQSGNNFYCPQAFKAQKISYTHNYRMHTGVGESKGWETIALPFDVQTISHETKGAIMPFAQWKIGDVSRPFWLMELTGTGFVEADAIKAYTPYIISMPNNLQYDSQWLLNGEVIFAASGVTVGKTEYLSQSSFSDRTFVPCFADKEIDAGVYALNVNNDYVTNNSGMTEGSRFVLNMRRVHPFEAYMTSSSSATRYAIGVFEDMKTGIQVMDDGRWTKEEVIYDLQGRKINTPSKKGIYIVNGKKIIQ